MPSDTTQTRPAAPPPAGRPPALTRDQVLAAALQIIDEGGVEALTMRRLGQALDRNPMGIYRHAADKDALLDLVVEHVVAELVVPHEPHRDGDGEDHVDWESALRRTAHAFRQIALAHPNVVPLLVNRSITGPLAQRPLGTLRPLEELLEVFISAGFDQHGALHAARLFTGFLYGHIQDELQEQVNDPDETDDLLRLGLHRLPITQFPRLRSLATVLATYDGAAELDEGLAIVIAGLRSQLLN
ncbi:MAG TPA: TetR/AcrR family transcriptional regulator [Actinophytocola sp.]|nr:TetR/AcrR family transcriptional regulator [Actinophytocola sp.]